MRKIIVTEYVTPEGGKRLFKDGREKKVRKLRTSRAFATGIVVFTYQPVGKESYYGHQD